MPDQRRTFLGHPPGLFVLFFAEMWERFSFYGMRGLLTLYMWKALEYSKEYATGTYGAYIGFVYATPVIGGMIADRFLGQRRAILLGGVLMCVGHFAMAVQAHWFFYGAMALIIAGNGFFKPNISAIVGALYEKADPRRDSAFTIFYMGINLGAGLAPLACGYLGEKVGWHYGFTLAGVGMVFGLSVFIWGTRWLGGHGLPPRPEALREAYFPGFTKTRALYLGVLVFVPFAGYMLTRPTWVEKGVYVLGPVVLLYILYEVMRSTRVEGARIIVILVLVFFSITFWACFEQAGSSMTLFAEEKVDRHILGWQVPTSWFQSVNPAFICLLAPLFAWLWSRLERSGVHPPSNFKFGLGLIQLGGGFVALVIGAGMAAEPGSSSTGALATGAAGSAGMAAEPGLSSMFWLILAYFLHTTGELCLSPVGLSTVTRLSPARLVGMMMGLWFLSNAFAGVISGIIARATTAEGGYGPVFTNVVYFAVGAGVLLLLLTPLLVRLEHRERLDPASE